MINFGKGALALARDSVHDRSGYEAYAVTGILMRRSECTTYLYRPVAQGVLACCPGGLRTAWNGAACPG
jgi:hypothetical protein